MQVAGKDRTEHPTPHTQRARTQHTLALMKDSVLDIRGATEDRMISRAFWPFSWHSLTCSVAQCSGLPRERRCQRDRHSSPTCLWTFVSCSRLFSRKEIFCFWAALPPPSSLSSSTLCINTKGQRDRPGTAHPLPSLVQATLSKSPFKKLPVPEGCSGNENQQRFYKFRLNSLSN